MGSRTRHIYTWRSFLIDVTKKRKGVSSYQEDITVNQGKCAVTKRSSILTRGAGVYGNYDALFVIGGGRFATRDQVPDSGSV